MCKPSIMHFSVLFVCIQSRNLEDLSLIYSIKYILTTVLWISFLGKKNSKNAKRNFSRPTLPLDGFSSFLPSSLTAALPPSLASASSFSYKCIPLMNSIGFTTDHRLLLLTSERTSDHAPRGSAFETKRTSDYFPLRLRAGLPQDGSAPFTCCRRARHPSLPWRRVRPITAERRSRADQ